MDGVNGCRGSRKGGTFGQSARKGSRPPPTNLETRAKEQMPQRALPNDNESGRINHNG